MPTIRVNKSKNYSVMSNYHFQDKRLSWKLKGMLSTMLSLPDTWDYSIAGLTQLADDGDSATRSGLKDLEKFGYLKRTPIREKGKIVDWEYTVYETPQLEEEKPLVENPQLANPQLENRTQSNTNIYNTKEESNILAEQCVEVIAYLNEKAGTRFRVGENNLKFVRARLKEYSIDDLKKVVDVKVKEWKGTNMQQYLRPETLFNATKFESYINGLETKQNTTNVVRDYDEREYTNEQFDSMITRIDDIIVDDI